jgi:hypothetical protein
MRAVIRAASSIGAVAAGRNERRNDSITTIAAVSSS